MMSTREKHPKIHRIALVDNDPRALDSLSAVIASKVPTAYVVWTATSGCEAIERCQDANGHVSLLILDMSMEGLQGPATCRRLRLMGQRMPILGATSFSINSYRDKLVEAGAQGLVGKENADQLAQIIMRMCNGEVMEGLSRLRWPICVSAGRLRPLPRLPFVRSRLFPCARRACLTGTSPSVWGFPKPPSANICKVF